MKYIVALNYQQFCYHVEKELGISRHSKDVFFVSTSYRSTDLRGRRIREGVDTIVRIGNYYDGRYLPEVLGELEMCKR